MPPLQFGIIERALDQFVADITAAIPRVLAGLVFLLLAGVLGKLLMIAVRALLRRMLPDDTDVYQRFIAGVVAAFLWFGISLSFLSIVGLDNIATSLGSAAGFLALGVSYSLSNMIADAVAGVYLLRDPDFMPGDRVEVGDVSGTVRSIELRKTRFRDENDDTVVRGNAEIEKKWTKLEDGTADGTADDGSDGGISGDVEEELDDEIEAQVGADEVRTETAETADDIADGADDAVDEATDELGDESAWRDANER